MVDDKALTTFFATITLFARFCLLRFLQDVPIYKPDIHSYRQIWSIKGHFLSYMLIIIVFLIPKIKNGEHIPTIYKLY